MSKSMHLTIRTPEKQVFKKVVKKITVDTETGRMVILPHHATMSAVLDFTPIKVVGEDNIEEDFVAKRGILEITNAENSVEILVAECIKTTEIIPTTAAEYLKFIQEQLKDKANLKDFHIKFLEEEKLIITKEISHHAKLK